MPLGAHKAAIMGVSGTAVAGAVVLIASETATSDAEINFTSGIDATYGEYIFKFYNMNPEYANTASFVFNGSIDGGSNYNVTKTTTYISATHYETGAVYAGGAYDVLLQYSTSGDLAQSTSHQPLAREVEHDADGSCVGELHLFNPSSTTYVKHFYATINSYNSAESSRHSFVAGYFNDTNNIDAMTFKFSTGDFEGTIKMWGVK